MNEIKAFERFQLKPLTAIGILISLLGIFLFSIESQAGLYTIYAGVLISIVTTSFRISTVTAILLFAGGLAIKNYFVPYSNFLIFISLLLLFRAFYSIWLKFNLRWYNTLFFLNISVFVLFAYFLQIDLFTKRVYVYYTLNISALFIILSYSIRFLSKSLKNIEDVSKLLIVTAPLIHELISLATTPNIKGDSFPPVLMYLFFLSLVFWAIYRLIINHRQVKFSKQPDS